MEKIKIRRIGNSLGIILPKDVLDLLGLSEGDEVDIDVEGGQIQVFLKKASIGR